MGPYCKFCGLRCFIPADMEDRKIPAAFQDVFVKRGCPILATCEPGKVLDKKELGFNSDDLIWIAKTEALDNNSRGEVKTK